MVHEHNDKTDCECQVCGITGGKIRIKNGMCPTCKKDEEFI